ncbi:MAG: hypothetical protein RXP97_03920 [Nitrososphaeria archaeon]
MSWWAPWPPWRGMRWWGPGWGLGWGYPYWWSYYRWQPQVEIAYLEAYAAALEAQLAAVRSRIAALKGSSGAP